MIVSDPPIVTTPNVIIRNESQLINLTCIVDANPPASDIRWEKVGDSLVRTDASYVFTAQKQHAGNYSCLARNRIEPSEGLAESVTTRSYTAVHIQCMFLLTIETYALLSVLKIIKLLKYL